MLKNWNLELDYFHPLEESDLSFFAAPEDIYRVATAYNEILQEWTTRHTPISVARLRQMTEDFPLFPQAYHLYGIVLAGSGQIEKAYEQLKNVLLLDVNEEEREQVLRELEILQQEREQILKDRAERERREALMTPVEAQLALRSILRKAPGGRSSYKKSKGMDSLYDGSNPGERRRTLLLVLLAVVCLVGSFLLYSLVLKPEKERIRQEDRILRERLQWLETMMEQLGEKHPDIQQLEQGYRQWIQAGQPWETVNSGEETKARTEETSNESIESNETTESEQATAISSGSETSLEP